MEMSLLHRALLVVDLVQMGQLHKSALLEVSRTMPWETATALSNRACPTGTQLRTSAGAGSQRSQSTNQHNSPKESTKQLRGNARWKVLSLPMSWQVEKGRHRVSESGADGFHFPHPSHTNMGARGGCWSLTGS